MPTEKNMGTSRINLLRAHYSTISECALMIRDAKHEQVRRRKYEKLAKALRACYDLSSCGPIPESDFDLSDGDNDHLIQEDPEPTEPLGLQIAAIKTQLSNLPNSITESILSTVITTTNNHTEDPPRTIGGNDPPRPTDTDDPPGAQNALNESTISSSSDDDQSRNDSEILLNPTQTSGSGRELRASPRIHRKRTTPSSKRRLPLVVKTTTKLTAYCQVCRRGEVRGRVPRCEACRQFYNRHKEKPPAKCEHRNARLHVRDCLYCRFVRCVEVTQLPKHMDSTLAKISVPTRASTSVREEEGDHEEPNEPFEVDVPAASTSQVSSITDMDVFMRAVGLCSQLAHQKSASDSKSSSSHNYWSRMEHQE